MSGSEKNIHIGSCGGLYPEINSTDFVLPTWSYGLESSASMYDRDNKDFKYYPDIKLSNNVESRVNKKYKVWKGPVISCQAMLGETFDDIQTWSKQGYYGVEMETPTVFSVSKHFNVPSASIMFVSDNLIKGQTSGDESHKNEKAKRDEVRVEVYRVAIKTILNA